MKYTNKSIKSIIEYLYDLMEDILAEKENPRYLANKIRVLIDKLPKIETEQKTKPITNKKQIKLIENKITENYFI